MSNPEQPTAPAPAAALANLKRIAATLFERIYSVTSQVGQQLSEQIIENGPQSALATRKLTPGEFKTLVEAAVKESNQCALCAHAETKPLRGLSCGHGCCKDCAEKKGPKRCLMKNCHQRVTVLATVCPKSKLFFDRKLKLDQRTRLALKTESEYGEELADILFKSHCCVECGFFKQSQRLLTNCGHLICQRCVEKHAEFKRFMCLNMLMKPKAQIDCPTCKVASTVTVGGFLNHDQATNNFYLKYKVQQMHNIDQIEHPMAKIETPKIAHCNGCNQTTPSINSFYECKTCQMEDSVCMNCIAPHEAEFHDIVAISPPEIRRHALQELHRLYHCADQYTMGILIAFELDFHHSQTGALVEKIVFDRDGIVKIYEGVAIAPIVIDGMAKQAIKKAGIHVKRLRMIMDIVSKDWPRLRSQAARMVDEVLEIPSDEEYDKVEDAEEEEQQQEQEEEAPAQEEQEEEAEAAPQLQPEPIAQREAQLEAAALAQITASLGNDSDNDYEVV